MIQKKINQLNTAIATVKFCEDSAAETASIANFAPAVALVKSKIVIVQSYNILGDKPTQGVTLNVRAIRQSMMEHTYLLASAVFVYAASLDPADQDLMAQAKLTVGSLEAFSKEKCATECDRIRQLADANAANISGYGATAADITDTQTLVTLYLNSISDPRGAAVSRKAANTQADLNLKNIMDNLLSKRLDVMANTLRYAKPTWWSPYHLSREVIDLGTTSTKLRSTVFDSDESPIKGATVSLLQNNIVIYSGKTDDEGKVSIVKIKPGNYNLQVEKANFITQTQVDVHFAPGSEKNHPFILMPATGPGGFEIQEFHVPSNGSLVFPFNIPNPIPTGIQIYLLAVNAEAMICTTSLPANPCMGGYKLKMGIPYKGDITGLGLDFSQPNIQVTNQSPNELTLQAGIKKS